MTNPRPQPFRHLSNVVPRRQADRALHIYNHLSAWICCGATRYRADRSWKTLTKPRVIPDGSPDLLFTYGDLAEVIGDGRGAGRTLAAPLGILAHFCKTNSVPLINTVVVAYESGEPGLGLISEGGKSLGQQQHEVLEFDWLNYRSPTSRTLKAIQDGWDEM